MIAPRIKVAASVLLVLATLHPTAQALQWVAINDELSLDADSIVQQGALQKVTIKLKGGVHDVLIYCKKRALLFNEEMIAASETPAGTELVHQVCDAHKKKWYEAWK